jgi:hypothetical protein
MNFISTGNGYVRKKNVFFIQKHGENQTKIYVNDNFQDYFIIDRSVESVLELLEDGE